MAATTAPPLSNGKRAPAGEQPRPAGGLRSGRHRQVPLVVLGVLLVAGCALAFADASVHLSSGEEVLVVAQPVAAGHVVNPGDLRAVRVSAGGGVASVPAGEEAAVVSRPAAVALAPGALLTRSEIGAGAGLAPGTDVVAVGLKAGFYPPGLAPGDRVEVVAVSSPSAGSTVGGQASGGSGVGPVRATVLAVQAASAVSGSPTVFSLQVRDADAAGVATFGAAGQASLVQVGGGA